MSSVESAKFLNLDLELESKSDLSPLAEFFALKNAVLFNGPIPGGYRLMVEPIIRGALNRNISQCTNHFLNLLAKLPTELVPVWESCRSRLFDYGFDGGAESAPLAAVLTSTQLLKSAKLGLGFRVTIYPHRAKDLHATS
jgi:hypothetical protein